MSIERWTIQALAEAVNAWCRDRRLEPANGQTASELSREHFTTTAARDCWMLRNQVPGADTDAGICSN